MSSLNDAVLHIQGLVQGISGIQTAPLYPTEQAGPFPFAVTHANDGVFESGAGGGIKGLHTIVIEIHLIRKELPLDVEAAMPYGDAVAALLLADTSLGGHASTFNRIRYTFGEMGWGGLETVGWKFYVEGVKIQ